MNTLLNGLGARLTAVVGSAPASHLAALKQLRAIAYQEASTLAYADAFRVIMLVFLIMTPLVLLLRKVSPVKTAPADAH